MSQVEVDVSQIEVSRLPEKAFPVSHSFRIHISEQAHADVWEHARATLIDGGEVKEVGGVLVGNIYRDSLGPYVDVKAAIIAEHTRSEGTEVAFTLETWDQINRVKDESYNDDLIVGWYHTHPRFGIFLSERDKFIQSHSFRQPWSTAFVVDPVQETEGFFFWSGGEPKEAPEYWVGQERRQYVQPKEESGGNPADPGSSQEAKSSISQSGLALALMIAMLSLVFAAGYVYWRESARVNRDKWILRALESQHAELDRSLQAMALLKSAVGQPKDQAAPPAINSVADPDPQITNRVREIETGLRRIGFITLVLEAAVSGQELAVSAPEENNPDKQGQ